MIDNDYSFNTQKLLAIKKTKNKCAWVLRTFQSRDKVVLRTLWKSLCQPHQDYGAQIWGPVGNKADLVAQEGPLRNYTKQFNGYKELNYWQRLSEAKLFSSERRNERFKLWYIIGS